MKDKKDKVNLISTPMTKSNRFYDMFMSSKSEKPAENTPLWIGVDWATNSGMNRGDIVSRTGNVVEVRFSTVTLK